MNSIRTDDLRRTLFLLRRRRGEYANKSAWLAEIARLQAALRAGSAELQAFEAIEVQGLTFKAAAARLGFSERHLYRVRQSMLEQLSSAPHQPITVEPLPAVEREIELASTLLARGHSTDVLPMVQRTLEAPASPASVVAALTLRVRAYTEMESFDAARGTLAEAHRYVNSIPSHNARILIRNVLMANAFILYNQGLFDKAIEMAERALGNITLDYTSDPYAKRALARQLIFLGVMHQEGGSPHSALRHLEAAHDLLHTLPSPPAAELAQIAIDTAFARVAIPGQIHHARLDARDALQRAEWHGLVYETIWANLAIAMVEEVAGQPEAGLPHAHAALALARSSFAGDPLARTLFLNSRVESAIGHHADSIWRLREAAPHVAQAGLMRGILHVAEARVYRDSQDTAGAIDAATRAIDALESKSQSHYIGIAYTARGVARHAMGRLDAREDAEAALFYLERGGSVKDMALALELSFKICGKRAHLDRARELRAAI